MDQKSKFIILKSLPLFKSLNDQEINLIVQIVIEKVFPAKSILIHQDDKTVNAYIIVSGCVKVYRLSKNGEFINLAIIGSKKIIGEMSLLDGHSRSATVEAIQKTKVLIINYFDFKKFLYEHPNVALTLLSILSQKIRDINQKFEDKTSKNLLQRTWKVLQILSQFYPNQKITLSHEQLAEIVDATRPRVSEILHQLQKNKKIKLGRRSILLF